MISFLIRTFILLLFTCNLFCFSQEKIRIVTEEYPPFNMEINGKVGGISTEIIKAVFNRAQINFSIDIYPWIKAYKIALENKNTAIYSMTQTPERYNRFKWVGPLVKNSWAFFAKEGSIIKIKSFQSAKDYKVGSYIGDAISLFLLKEGFKEGKNIILSNYDRENVNKLVEGKINLWASGTLLAPWLAKEAHVGLIKLYTFKKVEMYLAFNIETDQAVIKKLNNVLAQMKEDGEIDKIYKKYE